MLDFYSRKKMVLTAGPRLEGPETLVSERATREGHTVQDSMTGSVQSGEVGSWMTKAVEEMDGLSQGEPSFGVMECSGSSTYTAFCVFCAGNHSYSG